MVKITFIELLVNVSWISITLFIIGIGLLVVEMFEPGFGFFGIFGIISLIGCIFVTASTVAEGIMLTAFFFVIVLIMLGIFLFMVSKGKLPGKLVLKDAESRDDGYSGTLDLNEYMGKAGVVLSTCRPVGNVDFDGVKLEVVSLGEFIEKGTAVEVIEVEGNRVVVKPKE
ncbi:MAG: hypothetical protein FWD38_04890 [Oscillospiraceae bacterium]|nr:hypothetical protein [Oscillospiraceae bacterium]